MALFITEIGEVASLNYSADSVASADMDPSFALFAKFESMPLADEISGNSFVVSSGQDRIFVEEGSFGNALRMKPLVEISHQFTSVTLTSFSIGFWLKPVNITPTVNPQTGVANYYRMGLIDRGQFQLDSNGMIDTIPDETEFVVYEECREDDQNVMYILLQASSSEQVIYETPVYDTGIFHYFWITYSGSAEELRIFIDGVSQDLTLVEGAGVPSALNSITNTPLHINKSAIGHNTLTRGNFGLIDELVLQNVFVADLEVIARHINLGSEFVINDVLASIEEVYQAFAYDDPTTIDISSIYSNGKNIYAGRTDGKVLRGDRTMWKSRRDFSNREEIGFIQKRLLASDAIINIEDGALKLYRATARI